MKKEYCVCGELAEKDGVCSTCELAQNIERELEIKENNKSDWY
jgi:hypothetical protein